MAVADDSGGRAPTVPDDAGPVERQLFGVHEFDTWAAFLGANDWGKTADGVRGLALDVRRVVGRLTAADEPWTGPAAEAAFASLRTLATSLEDRAAEFDRIQVGLDRARQSATDAMVSYHREVRSISTAVDRADFERQAPRAPGGAPAPDGVAFDAAGFERALAARQAEREAAATRVLDTFTARLGEAADALPVDSPPDAVAVDRGSGGGDGAGVGGAGHGSSRYVAPSGGAGTSGPASSGASGTVSSGAVSSGAVSSGAMEVGPGTGAGSGVGAGAGPGGSGGVVVDSPVTGGGLTPIGPDPAAGPGAVGSSSAGVTPAGSGLAGTAAGVGGLAAGGAARLVGRAGAMSAGGLAGRSSLVVGVPSAAAGGGASRGVSGGVGRSGVVPVGGQAGTAGGRAGTGTTGRAGSTGIRSGRFGASRPVDAARGSTGAAHGPVVSAAAGAGRRGHDGAVDDDRIDVESLTHEDESAWFDGQDDASPPVWR
ncbi:MAG: hypothetical protein ACRCY8_17895 [Dermatophilaceae bacterium]